MNARRSGTILVVEDELETRLALRSIAEAGGFIVYDAAEGRSAYELTKLVAFDVIVSDIMMPDIDGLQFLEMIRAEGVTTPVIFATAYGSKNHLVSALRLAAFDFIEKPFHFDRFLDTITKALQLKTSKTFATALGDSPPGKGGLEAKIAAAELSVSRVRALRMASEEFSVERLKRASRLGELREDLQKEAGAILRVCQKTIDWLLRGKAGGHETAYLVNALTTIGEASRELGLVEASAVADLLISIFNDLLVLDLVLEPADQSMVKYAHQELVWQIGALSEADGRGKSGKHDDILLGVRELAARVGRQVSRQRADRLLSDEFSASTVSPDFSDSDTVVSHAPEDVD